MPIVIAQSTLPSPNGFCSEGVCYIRPDPGETKTWEKAQQSCKNYNSTLPIVENLTRQNVFVVALSNYNLTNKDVWLGATAVEYKSTNWLWLDGNQYSATGKKPQRRHTVMCIL